MSVQGKGVVEGLVLAVFLLAVLNGCGEKSRVKAGTENADTAAVRVVVTEVTESSFEEWGSYSADLRGIEDAVLTAPYQGGRVGMVKRVGVSVKAGEPLCAIDAEKYEAALEAARAQLAMTKGDLERAKINVEKGSLGRSVLDGATLAYQNARMLEASARRAYDDCRCLAPFDGVLVSRSIERYQTVSPSMPTMRVARTDRMEAVISIPEAEAFSYREGMKTEFRLLQNPENVFEGKLTSLDRVVDSPSRTVTARVTIANKNTLLKPGMVGRVRILRRRHDEAVIIPSSALVRLQEGVTVMVVDNGHARQRNVRIGAVSGDSTLVKDGLFSGDTLIVTGAFQVSEGTRVAY